MEQFEQIIGGLLDKGYGVLDNFLNESQVRGLNQSFSGRYENHEFLSAGISKNATEAKTVRGDEIFWLDQATANAPETEYLEKIQDFILYLNRTCFLGLHDAELHYASYPIGTFYKRHLDRFRNDSARKLSIICYLNESWQLDNGGELVLHLPEGEKRVLPLGGRLVCFESDQLEHEVSPANRERRSITGWLRQ